MTPISISMSISIPFLDWIGLMPIEESSRKLFVKRFHLNSSIDQSTKVKCPSYLCPQCSKRFLSPSHLNRHLLTHTREKPCLCSECGQQFSQSSSLERHERTKHQRNRQMPSNYQCSLCHEYFSLKHNLKMHERKLHQNPTNFFCQICSAYFTCNSSLQKHRNFRHRTVFENTDTNTKFNNQDLNGNTLDLWTDSSGQRVRFHRCR